MSRTREVDEALSFGSAEYSVRERAVVLGVRGLCPLTPLEVASTGCSIGSGIFFAGAVEVLLWVAKEECGRKGASCN